MTLLILAAAAAMFAAFPAVLYFRNVPVYRPPPPAGSPASVSVLIPARNEEGNIAAAVQAALASAGVAVEVVVLDDHSDDRTADIVRRAAAADPRVRLEPSPPLPAGWCGKQHACHVLSTVATHDYFLFVDADVRLEPDAAARMVGFLRESKADLISGIPRQVTGTVFEQLMIPLIHFLLLGFLPLGRMRQSGMASLGAGCGQLFLATRAGYEKAGGHAAIRASRHDGLTLPRAFRKAGMMTDLFDATAVASCRMYRSATQVWFGLAKNAREGLASGRLIGPATVILLTGQVVPFVLLVWWAESRWRTNSLTLTAVVCSLAPRIDAAIRFRQPLWSAILHPLGVLIVVLIQWFALARDVVGIRAPWKGRPAVTPSGPAVDSPSP